MRTVRLFTVVPIIVPLIAVNLMCATQHQQFRPDEVRPVLEVVSRLGHVVVFPESQYFRGPSLRVCWLDATEFRGLDDVLWKYPGVGRWFFIQDLPCRCLAVEPNVLKGEPFPVEETDWLQARAQLQSVETDLDNRGLHVPWGEAQIVSPEEFRATIVREIPKLAQFLEEVLSLRGKPSFGIEFSDLDLRLPLMEDQDGPGAGVVLAADPNRYSSTKLSTSPYDRTLHFWITDHECDELWSEMSQNTRNKETDWPFLSKVVTARYGGLVVAPGDVDALASETARLRRETGRISLTRALDRILSVCRSAQHYHLGLYLPGE